MSSYEDFEHWVDTVKTMIDEEPHGKPRIALSLEQIYRRLYPNIHRPSLRRDVQRSLGAMRDRLLEKYEYVTQTINRSFFRAPIRQQPGNLDEARRCIPGCQPRGRAAPAAGLYIVRAAGDSIHEAAGIVRDRQNVRRIQVQTGRRHIDVKKGWMTPKQELEAARDQFLDTLPPVKGGLTQLRECMEDIKYLPPKIPPKA